MRRQSSHTAAARARAACRDRTRGSRRRGRTPTRASRRRRARQRARALRACSPTPNQSTRRRHGEDGADRLREPLRRAGRVAVRDRSRGVTTRVASSPSGLSVGPVSARATKAVGQHGQEPTLLECDGDDREHRNRSRDDPRRGLVDGVRETRRARASPDHATHGDQSQVGISSLAVARARHRSAAAPASRPASRSSRCRCACRAPASAPICSDRRRASSRARSACRGAAAPGRRSAAGSSSTRRPSTARSSARP